MLVTSEAQVCQVEPAMVLSAELRESLMACAHNGKGYSLSPHFRSGYWSRPVGSGDDPFAKKTVWHNPTIVRKDLLKDGSLPVGKMMSVKK
jgi:hypothetical protein